MWPRRSKLRASLPRHCRGTEYQRQPLEECAATLQCGPEPGTAGHPAKPQDRSTLTIPAQVGFDPTLVLRPEGRPQADQCQGPTFRDAYACRRCIVPVDGFFEWCTIRGARAKQPYAITMKGGSPFGLAGLWENWKNPTTREWERTFAVITVPSNELIGQIHNRMPAILEPKNYHRWLGLESDPRDLLITFPSQSMTMWPISTRVNKPENDDASILDRAAEPFDWQAPLNGAA